MKPIDLADKLHSQSIHLLRRVKVVDGLVGLSGPLLSCLSVLVFSGPLSLSRLAEAEQVSRPTMTVTIKKLEKMEFVNRQINPKDSRSFQIRATKKGRAVMLKARENRLLVLENAVKMLSNVEQKTLEKNLDLMATLIGTLKPIDLG